MGRAFHEEIDEHTVFDHGRPDLARSDIDENFRFHMPCSTGNPARLGQTIAETSQQAGRFA